MGPAGLVALLVVRYRVLFRGATVRRHFMGLQRPPLHSTWVTGFFFLFLLVTEFLLGTQKSRLIVGSIRPETERERGKPALKKILRKR